MTEIVETSIDGVFILDIERHEDERGFFARTWDAAQFAKAGIEFAVAQCSLSYNRTRGTLRGMHFQVKPAEEAKLVRCTAGAIHDVVLDLREASATFLEWLAVELSAESRRALFVPPGVAHGFQTLCNDSEVEYLISVPYRPELSRGVRWDDQKVAIDWPSPPSVISARDAALPTVEEYLEANREG